MNQKLHIVILVLGMMTLMPSICFARSQQDSLLLNRIWDYYRLHAQPLDSAERNIYTVFTIDSKRRNVLLWLIPTMYSIAKDERQYIGEAYGKVKFHSMKEYDLHWRVECGTIPHNRHVMPALYNLMIPSVYGELLYEDMLLSPFFRSNHKFYDYLIRYESDEKAYLTFTPRIDNTQLVKGEAIVNPLTGCILYTVFSGNFDMVRFKVFVTMNPEDPCLLPAQCKTKATFRCVGNHINADVNTYYLPSKLLHYSIPDCEDRHVMDSIRPRPLTGIQEHIYHMHDSIRQEEAARDTLSHKHNNLKDFTLDVLGNHMINSTRAHSGPASMRISPLLNPLYMSYSNSKGISYKLKVEGRVDLDSKNSLAVYSRFGYSFKKHQFYFDLPLRWTFTPRRNGYVEIKWSNGDRLSNEALAESFKKVMGDTLSMPEFRSEYLKLVYNIKPLDWLEVTGGISYQIRRSTNARLMRQAQLAERFRNLSPLLTVQLTPWHEGPTFTVNYERSIKNVFHSDLNYERWEYDLSYKRKIASLRLLNFRAGTGFYTHRNSNYFVDYTNFRDENLPTGWDDDWSGQFHLAPLAWYNQSDYYLRGHISYDSPLVMLSWLPWLGRFVETERIYASAMSIQHARPYLELGYGFKCRYFSTAIFTSFLNSDIQRVGFKFTLELFSRW